MEQTAKYPYLFSSLSDAQQAATRALFHAAKALNRQYNGDRPDVAWEVLESDDICFLMLTCTSVVLCVSVRTDQRRCLHLGPASNRTDVALPVLDFDGATWRGDGVTPPEETLASLVLDQFADYMRKRGVGGPWA